MIQLVPMTQPEFEQLLSVTIKEYAQEHVKSGNWSPEEALDRSKAEHDQLLPNGLHSPDQYLYSIYDPDTKTNVGILWWAHKRDGAKQYAFIYNIEIKADQRGKGYGKQAMLALEEKVKAAGLDSIGLHVFGHNRIARSLYSEIGYEETNVLMSKKLS